MRVGDRVVTPRGTGIVTLIENVSELAQESGPFMKPSVARVHVRHDGERAAASFAATAVRPREEGS